MGPASTGTRTTRCARPGRARASAGIRPKGRAPAHARMAAAARGGGRRPGRRSAALAHRGWLAFPARAPAQQQLVAASDDFSHEVKEAMDGCLACKSCVGPVPDQGRRADLPGEVSRTLLRPLSAALRHHVVAWLETLLPWLAQGAATRRIVADGHRPAAGGDRARPHAAPLRASNLEGETRASRRRARHAGRAVVRCRRASAGERRGRPGRVHELLRDAASCSTSSTLLIALGFRPWLAPFRPNGKPLHVHGFLGAFERLAARQRRDATAASPRRASTSSASIPP